jgi:hypothetical protein
LLGCATPSRHLTTRVVEDPLVLPRGLFAASVPVSATKYSTRDDLHWTWNLTYRYGITDRLELSNFALRYAFLDDAPAYTDGAPDGRRRGPLSLSVRGGVEGIGYSSIEGLIVLPTLSLFARKHIGGRAFIWASAGADAGWTTSSATLFPDRYSSSLWPRRPYSRVAVSVGGVIQVVDRVALGAGGGVNQIHACAVFDCGWAARGASGFAGPTVRPWRWLELRLSGEVGARERSAVDPVIDPSTMMFTLPPDHVWWWSVTGSATFYW